MESVVNGYRVIAKPGEVIYIPAGTIHFGRALPGADVVFFTVKDTSHDLDGVRGQRLPRDRETGRSDLHTGRDHPLRPRAAGSRCGVLHGEGYVARSRWSPWSTATA